VIKASWLGAHRIDLETCSSTNDEAGRLARAGASHGTVVISDRQTAGRGRDGRVWQSPPGGLYLSAILRPPVALDTVPPMTLAVGIGVCDAVRACGVGGVLKWPNDILVDADSLPRPRLALGDLDAPGYPQRAPLATLDWRKLAGVLVEAQSQSGRLDAVIVGIGINLASVGLNEVSPIATSLERETGEPPGRELVIERLLAHVERWVDRYTAIGLPAVIPAWHERMAHGLIARATIDGALVIGEVAGLDPEGALMLRDGTGKLWRVRSGDVEVIRPAASGSGPVTDTAVCPNAC